MSQYVKSRWTTNDLFLLEDCSQKYYYKSLATATWHPYSPIVTLAKFAIESLFDSCIKQKIKERKIVDLFDEALTDTQKKLKLNEAEKDELRLNGLGAFDKLMSKLWLADYVPVYGWGEYNMDIDRKYVGRVELSGILQSDPGAYKALCFSPYTKSHQIEWSATHRLQFEALKIHYQNKGYVAGRPAPLCIIYSPGGYRLEFETFLKTTTDDWKGKLSLMGTMIKASYHYPNSPCRDMDCPFRDQCNPGTKKK